MHTSFQYHFCRAEHRLCGKCIRLFARHSVQNSRISHSFDKHIYIRWRGAADAGYSIHQFFRNFLCFAKTVEHGHHDGSIFWCNIGIETNGRHCLSDKCWGIRHHTNQLYRLAESRFIGRQRLPCRNHDNNGFRFYDIADFRNHRLIQIWLDGEHQNVRLCCCCRIALLHGADAKFFFQCVQLGGRRIACGDAARCSKTRRKNAADHGFRHVSGTDKCIICTHMCSSVFVIVCAICWHKSCAACGFAMVSMLAFKRSMRPGH